jgi:hypothetical protein
MSRAVVVSPRCLMLPALGIAPRATARVDGDIHDVAVIPRRAPDWRLYGGHAAAAAAYRATAARIARRAGRRATFLLSA